MKRGGIILLGLLLAAAVVMWFVARSRKPDDRTAEILIQFSCDTRGRLVPCGCFSGQMGGLTRLHTALESLPGTNVLRFDVGDALENSEDYNVLKYDYLLRAFAGMRFDVLNVGQREAGLPAATLRRLKDESPVPIISANLVDETRGETIFPPSRLLTVAGFRVAVIGVLDEHLGPARPGSGVSVLPMKLVLANQLPALAKEADAIILLAFAPEPRLRELAREFPELDVVLGGKVSQPSQQLERENRTAILYTANESRSFGLLTLRLATGRTPEAVAGEVLLLHDDIPEAATVQALAAQYRDQVRATKLNIDDPDRQREDVIPGVQRVASFVGSESCLGCHSQAAKVWENSAHAHAFDTLVQKRADADPSCVGCHTIGFGTPSGYRREFGRERLTHVGCESCHGPGSLHVEQRTAGKTDGFRFRPLAAGDCKQCHYGEFSRPFDWSAMWPVVAHGRETPSAPAPASRE